MIVYKYLWFALMYLEVVYGRYHRFLAGYVLCYVGCTSLFWKVGLWKLVSGWLYYLIRIACSAVRKTRKLQS